MSKMNPLTKEERLQGRTELELVERSFKHTKAIWKEAKRLERIRAFTELKALLKKWCFSDIYAIEKWGEMERAKIKKLKELEAYEI